MKKILLFISFVMFVTAGYSFAQNNLSGKIKSGETGESLPAVNIYIPEIGMGTISDENGNYNITGLPAGVLNIQFSYIGYKTLLHQLQISNGNNEFSPVLQRTGLELGEVVVIGNSFIDAGKAPYKVDVITSNELMNNGHVTLTQAIASLPGISLQSNGLGISKPVIRGLSGYRIATVLNGVRFDNQQWQEEHGFGLEEAGIDRVEVIEGPASLFYGAEALGGVINLLPEKNAPVGRILGKYDLRLFTNTLGAYSALGFKGADKKINWQLHLGGQTHADYLAGNGEKIPNTRFATLNAGGMLGYFYNWGFSNLEYSFANNMYGVVEEGELNNPKEKEEEHFEREFEGPYHTITYHIISLRNTFFAGNSKIKLDLGFQNNLRKEEEGEEEQLEGDAGELELILNTFTSNLEWINSLSNTMELTAGLQGTFQGNENEGGRILVPDAELNELSGFVYLKQNYFSLSIETGLRYDHKTITTERMPAGIFSSEMLPIDRNYNVFNGAAGISYFFNDNLSGKINIATGYRAPNLAELSSNGVHEGTTRFEIGNSLLEKEQNFQVDAGINYQVKNLSANISYFNNNVRNFIYLNPTAEFISQYRIYRFVQTDAVIQGGEAKVDYKPFTNLSLSASFSSLTGLKEDESYLPFMPSDKIFGKAEINLPEFSSFYNSSVFASLSHFFKQTKVSNEELPASLYTLVDAGVKTSFILFGAVVNAALVATNIFDEYYISHLSLLKPLGVHDIGRNITLSLNYPFIVK